MRKSSQKTLNIYLLIFLAASSLIIIVNRSMFSIVHEHKDFTSTIEEYTSRFSSNQCVSLDYNNDMDNILSEVKLVYVVMPAKAAGSTIKTFTSSCMKEKGAFAATDNILNKWHGDKDKKLFQAIMGSIELPSVIASHVYSSESMVDLIKHSTRKSLIIYVHREETDRLKSAIESVVSAECLPSSEGCKQKEEDILKFVRQGWVEISLGAPRILTCDVYEAVEQNRPNMMFMHYTKVNKLLGLLAKHHCKGQTSTEHMKVRSTNQTVVVELEKNSQKVNGTTHVNVRDWIETKSELIEFVTGLKDEASCLAETKIIEGGLSECPDQTLWLSAGPF